MLDTMNTGMHQFKNGDDRDHTLIINLVNNNRLRHAKFKEYTHIVKEDTSINMLKIIIEQTQILCYHSQIRQ